MRIIQLVFIAIVMAGCVFCQSNKDYFSSFPEGFTPEEVGTKLSQRFISGEHMFYAKWIHYAEVCTWYGALQFAQVTDDQELINNCRIDLNLFSRRNNTFCLP